MQPVPEMISLTLWLIGGWIIFECSLEGARLQKVDLREHMGPAQGLLWVVLWPLILLIAVFYKIKE